MTNYLQTQILIVTTTVMMSGFIIGCESSNEEKQANVQATQEEMPVLAAAVQKDLPQDAPSVVADTSITLAGELEKALDSIKPKTKDNPLASNQNPLTRQEPGTSEKRDLATKADLSPLRSKPQGLAPKPLVLKDQVVVISPISLDIGKISTSEKRSGIVKLTNTGDEPVTLLAAKASCGCTTSDFRPGTVLAPGESKEVTVTMNGKGRSRKISKIVTFTIDGYPSITLPVLAEAISYVTLDRDPLVIDEEAGFSVLTLTSIDDQPFTVESVYPLVVTTDFSTEPATTQQITINWEAFWDSVTTTKIQIRLNHPLCKEITTTVRLTAEQRAKLNRRIQERRSGGEILTKDPTRPLTGDQLNMHIKAGRGKQVLKFIDEGLGKFNAVDRGGAALLSTAAQKGDIDTVIGLLELGALLERVDRVNRTPLMYAARSKTPDVIQLLLDRGADIQARDNLGNTPLSWAAGFGTVKAVQLFIDAGADTNTVDNVLGYTPLLWASGFGDAASIPILIEAGADVNVYDTAEGRTPLMHAVRTGAAKGVGELLQAGANVNGIDNTGMTALHIGAGNKNVTLDKIKLLVNAGADLNAEDKNGQTPLTIAKSRSDEAGLAIAAYLAEQISE